MAFRVVDGDRAGSWEVMVSCTGSTVSCCCDSTMIWSYGGWIEEAFVCLRSCGVVRSSFDFFLGVSVVGVLFPCLRFFTLPN